MAGYSGAYTRGGDPAAMLNEELRYLAPLHRPGTAVVDADMNDGAFTLVHQLRRIIENAIGTGSPNTGFKIEEATSPSNNFKIKGGDGTDDGAGRFFHKGFPAALNADVDYTGAYVARMKRVMPEVTALTSTVLTDSAANWTVNEHAGKTLTPNIESPGTTFTILSNTATAITVTAPDMTVGSAVRKHYRIEASTPGGTPRTDTVYLDLFLDEVDDVEDTNLVHTALTPSQSAAFRLCLRQFVRIKENGSLPSNYVDTDGRQHYLVALATLVRPAATASILTAQITDLRPTVAPGGGSIAVQEVDLSPSVSTVNTIRFPNGSVTDLGGGIVSVATGGASALTAETAHEITLTHDIAAVTSITPSTTGTDIDTQDYTKAAGTQGQRFEFTVPDDYASGALELLLVYRMSTAVGTPNNVIRVSTQAKIVDVSAGAIDSATYPETQADHTVPDGTTNIVRENFMSLTAGSFAAGDDIQFYFKRLAGHANDLHTGDLKVIAYEVRYTASLGGRVATKFIEFTSNASGEAPTTPGSIGTDINTENFGPGADSGQKLVFVVPDNWDETSDAQIRLDYAMSSAFAGTVRLETSAEIANVFAGSVDTLAAQNFDLVPPVDTNPHRTVTVRSLPISALHKGDLVKLKLARRVAVGGNHTGTFQLVSATVTFGISLATVAEISVTNAYLENVDFKVVSGTPSGFQESPDYAGDFETWQVLISPSGSSEIHAIFQGRLGPGQTAVSSIKVPLKGNTGTQHRLRVYVEGSGAVPVYDSGLIVSPLTRTLTTLGTGDLSAQPTGEGRYFVVVEAVLDAAEELRVGLPYVRQE